MSIKMYVKPRCFICGKIRKVEELANHKHEADKRICQRCQQIMKEYRKDKGFGSPILVNFDNKK